MSAITVPYWGEAGTDWETSITTTTDLTQGREPASICHKQLMFVVDVDNQSTYAKPQGPRFRMGGRLQPPRMILVQAPQGYRQPSSETLTSSTTTLDWSGIVRVLTTRRLLFAKTIRLELSQLRRLKPRILIEPSILDDSDE